MLSENPREKKRSLFFLTGLVAALSLVIILLQSSTSVKTYPDAPVLERVRDVNSDIPITLTRSEKKPDPKRLEKLAPDPKADPDFKLEIPTKMFSTDPGDQGEDPVPIDEETGLEEVAPVEIVFLEFIAVPVSCDGLTTREEKVSCMNRWISDYLKDNLRYPSKASGLRLSDKVILSFVISPTGEITEVEVKRGEYDLLNNEALRALQSMPDWIPAKQFTQNVPMRMIIPVQFRAR